MQNNSIIFFNILLQYFIILFLILQYQFLKDSITDNQVAAVFNKFVLTEKLIEEHDLCDFAITFIPLLSYIAEAKPDISIETVQKTKDKLKYKEFCSLFYDMFLKNRKN